MVNTLRVNIYHGRDFHPPANLMTTLQRVTNYELQLMFDQPLSNLIVCLMIS